MIHLLFYYINEKYPSICQSAPRLVDADKIARATKTDSNLRLRPNTMQML